MNYSVVDYLSISKDGDCGYCKSSETSISHGMWAHLMTADDYQHLIDRGWRRCGMYCYKPLMNETCCPAYTIRCQALNLALTKSQKKVLRKITTFLKGENCDKEGATQNVELEGHSSDFEESRVNDFKISSSVPQPLSREERQASSSYSSSSIRVDEMTSESLKMPALPKQPPTSALSSPAPGVGADCTKPPRKKSKLLRLERKIEKMRSAGIVFTPSKNVTTPEKTLEDFVRENDAAYPRKLELELVPSCSDEKILQECYNLYKKYQMSVHKDEESELTFSSFSNFLVVSPLQPYKDAETPDCGYGSFHQLYRLDGKLIAVGVVDILPRCVSSVYFFYDPDYSYLSLGTYGSLRELHLTRSLARQSPQLNQYYLGFYIHTCPKMRYKGRLQPSYLLCPEAYTWHPISSCLSKLDSSKYSRLNDDKNVKSAEDDVDLDKILILDKSILPFSFFKTKHEVSPTKLYMLREYALLVGKTCASRMFLRW